MVGRGLTKNPRNLLIALWYPKSKHGSCPRSCPSRLSRRPRRFFRAAFLRLCMPGWAACVAISSEIALPGPKQPDATGHFRAINPRTLPKTSIGAGAPKRTAIFMRLGPPGSKVRSR
jgi:hypothetical protein